MINKMTEFPFKIGDEVYSILEDGNGGFSANKVKVTGISAEKICVSDGKITMECHYEMISNCKKGKK